MKPTSGAAVFGKNPAFLKKSSYSRFRARWVAHGHHPGRCIRSGPDADLDLEFTIMTLLAPLGAEHHGGLSPRTGDCGCSARCRHHQGGMRWTSRRDRSGPEQGHQNQTVAGCREVSREGFDPRIAHFCLTTRGSYDTLLPKVRL